MVRFLWVPGSKKNPWDIVAYLDVFCVAKKVIFWGVSVYWEGNPEIYGNKASVPGAVAVFSFFFFFLIGDFWITSLLS